MIVTVTLNASWDITYQVGGLMPGNAHRITGIDERAGGKGLNVARVLHATGCPVLITGLVGGTYGARIRADVAAAGLTEALIDSGMESRRTVTVVDDGTATLLSEPGPETLSWPECRGAIGRNFTGADVVVLAGSIPPGAPASAYRDLVEDAHSAGAIVIVDADGPALLHALEAKPDLVKPNASELFALTGAPEARVGAAELVSRGARAVVVSLGADGMIAFDGVSSWQIPAVRLTPVNPTGAGDAAVAGLADGLRRGEGLGRLIERATGLAARAVLTPAAGDLGPETLEGLEGPAGLELSEPAATPVAHLIDGAEHA